jgi:hypothetical protein
MIDVKIKIYFLKLKMMALLSKVKNCSTSSVLSKFLAYML